MSAMYLARVKTFINAHIPYNWMNNAFTCTKYMASCRELSMCVYEQFHVCRGHWVGNCCHGVPQWLHGSTPVKIC